MCIILVANVSWRSGQAIRSSVLRIFSFLRHSCRRVVTVFYAHSYKTWSFGRALNRNTFWPSNPFSAMVADVSSQFPTSQLYNMIVLAVRLIGTLFRRQIVPSMHAKMVRRTHWALRWIISNFKNSYQPENAKTKNWCHRHLNIVSNSINIRSWFPETSQAHSTTYVFVILIIFF